MPDNPGIPVFAVVGHPNEGKSSVVSTLSEDDRVRVAPEPGTTVVCRAYPILIDGVEIIRFVDTPGFQSPRRTLAWFKAYGGEDLLLVNAFLDAHGQNAELRDECELLSPIAAGAGIIYVVDGSRPLRGNDRAEMEILRMTGRPRMAILNCKTDREVPLEAWKNELRKHFNMVRVFNAHHATYRERIDLLESLKSIDQDWQPALTKVIAAFKEDWSRRNSRSAELIVQMIVQCMGHRAARTSDDPSQARKVEKELVEIYREDIRKIEKKTHREIKERFKHNIFDYDLPPGSIAREDLFSKRTWQLLGLTPGQLAIASGVTGGIIGGMIDAAAAGLTFGIFTAIGGLAGAGAGFFGGRRMVGKKVVGLNLGGIHIQIGPNENIQLMFILLDRALMYYSHVIHRAHGRRDNAREIRCPQSAVPSKIGYAGRWNESEKRICRRFFSQVRRYGAAAGEEEELAYLVKQTLDEICAEQN